MIETRLTRAFGLAHPIDSVPMARASGGRLAAAVTPVGGLGLIGGGYGDAAWIEAEFATGNAIVGEGIGLIHHQIPAAEIVESVVREAAALLSGAWRKDV